ncbi:pentapeptide repeat-containing protein [Arenicellales bacterium nBUS_48]
MKKLLPLILSTLLLASCSGPDSSGGVEFSKTANVFPFGSCRGSGHQTHSTERTGCGWFSIHEKSYYIKPHANLSGANLSYTNLSNADLRDAMLSNANLKFADLWHAHLNYSWRYPNSPRGNNVTICPSGGNWGNPGNDCGF